MASRLDVDALQERLGRAAPAEVMTWAEEAFGAACIAPVSLQNPVLPHLVSRYAPSVPLVFIDTGYHFKATLRYKDELESRLGVQIQVVGADAVLDDRWQTDVAGCCSTRKVEPLEDVLVSYQAFVTGVRRADHAGRARAKVVEWDDGFGRYRIQPLVAMSDDALARYIEVNSLPRHPLQAHGYPSIGCWPCTSRIDEGEEPRAGRWREGEQVECGINHLYG